ncbi:Amino acid transporter AVT3B [Cardamine amara subsp. amara]|uniref:Amino acid transporter AVT3B n=1 Tax=Cardamine amara subsp. amara TaxID=228776 RepID=A0ABD1B996_CARAN
MGFEKEREREDTPLLGNGRPLSSQFKTFANVFIAIVGAGVLGLPYAFKRTGWLMGLLILFTVAALINHCMMLLVYIRRKLGVSSIGSFGDLGFAVSGPLGRFVVDILIILSQAGFCVGYLIFIGTTLANLFHNPTMTSSLTLSLRHLMGVSPKSLYIWGCFPFQLGLNSIKTLTHLAPLSIFADVVDLGAMAVVIVEDVKITVEKSPQVVAFGGISVFFYGMGVALYAYEVVGMVLPLETEMKEKEKFGKVLALSMLFITVMYGSFGVLGYMAFGDETMDIITANLGAGVVSSIVQLGLCINLFFTFPIMMNPVFEIMERRFWSGMYCAWLRWVLVLAVTLVALLVPNFADFMSLVGSSVCCALGFVLPAYFHLMVFKNEMGWKQWALDVGIVLLGIILAVSGTWSSLSEILS